MRIIPDSYDQGRLSFKKGGTIRQIFERRVKLEEDGDTRDESLADQTGRYNKFARGMDELNSFSMGFADAALDHLRGINR